MSWTIPTDLIDSWIGDDAPEDLALIQTWLDKAEREIRRRVPTLQTRLDLEAELDPPNTDLLESAKDVAVAMVTRVFRNPAGDRQINTTTGPYSESATIGGDTPGSLALTGDELDKLEESGGGSRAFSIDMIPATSPYSPHYVNTYPWDRA